MDEYMDPHSMNRQSLAEANIIEQIRNNIKTLAEGIGGLQTLINTVSDKTLYEASNVLEKILKIKDESFEANVKLLSYISRVSIGIYKRDLYLGIITNLIDFGERIGEVGLSIKALVDISVDVPQSYIATIGKMVNDISNQAMILDRLLHKLNIGSHDIGRELNEIRKLEEDIDNVFKDLYSSIFKDLAYKPQILYLIKDLVYMLEKLSDYIWRIAIYANMIVES